MNSPANWVLEEVSKLIGQSESMTLEFKRSTIFESDRNTWIQGITKEVTAFANTIGGVIVVGMAEEKQNQCRVATGFDEGISFSKLTLEQIQQTVESNVHPHLTGLRFKAIKLPSGSERYIMLIIVPAGNTAYQAKDFIYYGRSEYQCLPLPDHEIRLRMTKGAKPSACVEVYEKKIEPQVYSEAKLKEYMGKDSDQYSHYFDPRVPGVEVTFTKLYFRVGLRNTGEIDLTQFKVAYEFFPNDAHSLKGFADSYRDGFIKANSFAPMFNKELKPQNVCIFPSDILNLRSHFVLLGPGDKIFYKGVFLRWKVFLSNSIPVTGEIDINSEFADELA